VAVELRNGKWTEVEEALDPKHLDRLSNPEVLRKIRERRDRTRAIMEFARRNGWSPMDLASICTDTLNVIIQGWHELLKDGGKK
jgi:hypothetical protein